MDDQQLIGTLYQVGMACFVRYYACADDPSLRQRIRDADGYTPDSCKMRARGIRIIIRHGRGKDALAIIAKSGRVDAEARKKASALLDQTRTRP